uniref:Uncharacterized protein n=1 Tax=Stomoxys calcitrans TaxID=35570 RepID=A0A1I8NR81_STOCA
MESSSNFTQELKVGDLCYDCQQKGIESRLRYFLINLNEDTLLKCESDSCMYPYNEDISSSDEEEEDNAKFLETDFSFTHYINSPPPPVPTAAYIAVDGDGPCEPSMIINQQKQSQNEMEAATVISSSKQTVEQKSIDMPNKSEATATDAAIAGEMKKTKRSNKKIEKPIKKEKEKKPKITKAKANDKNTTRAPRKGKRKIEEDFETKSKAEIITLCGSSAALFQFKTKASCQKAAATALEAESNSSAASILQYKPKPAGNDNLAMTTTERGALVQSLQNELENLTFPAASNSILTSMRGSVSGFQPNSSREIIPKADLTSISSIEEIPKASLISSKPKVVLKPKAKSKKHGAIKQGEPSASEDERHTASDSTV